MRHNHPLGKDLFIFGSANLTGSLTKQGLIDEYRIGLNPALPSSASISVLPPLRTRSVRMRPGA
ncbi:MAG TPA: dihydrofolate reductase family protein [Thermoanaerobaculia bacterium]|nr:dihydrofolate reductase family protein [Thermoanaerobaculia bacterium]